MTTDTPLDVCHATMILAVRKNRQVAIAGYGQVSPGSTVIKSNAKKLRRLGDGLAGATADAITLFECPEAKLEQYPSQLSRAWNLRRTGAPIDISGISRR